MGGPGQEVSTRGSRAHETRDRIVELAAYARRFRDTQLEFARVALERESISPDRIPPMVVLLLTTGLAQVTAQDRLIGLTDGHDETRAWIENWLAANTAPVKE